MRGKQQIKKKGQFEALARKKKKSYKFSDVQKGWWWGRTGISFHSDENPLPCYSSGCVVAAGCQFNTPCQDSGRSAGVVSTW